MLASANRVLPLQAFAIGTFGNLAVNVIFFVPMEAGVKDYEAIGWFGLMAPAGTPPAIVEQLSAEVARAMATPTLRERTLEQGATPVASKPAEFERFVRDEIGKWTRIIQEAGIKLD